MNNKNKRGPMNNIKQKTKNLFIKEVAEIKKNQNEVVQYNEADDDSKWESEVSVEMFTKFLGLVQEREFEEAIALAGDILKIDPDNQIIQQYLKVLDEHKTLAEEREAERDEEDDEDEDEDDDDDDDEKGRAAQRRYLREILIGHPLWKESRFWEGALWQLVLEQLLLLH